MDSNALSTTGVGPNTTIPRRRSAVSITERVNAFVSLRRPSTNGTRPSRSRAGSDLSSGPRAGNSTVSIFTRSAANSRDHSTYNTEDDRESSEEVHSIDDSSEFGLLEDDPFANLHAPPSGYQTPFSSTIWLRTLSSEVIREEPEETFEKEAKRLSRISVKRLSSLDSLQFPTLKSEESHEDDGDVSVCTQDSHEQRSRSVDGGARKRVSSLTERFRNLVQSRPSLPSLSLLANTKIFMPTSALTSRFPSEPWDDPKYTADSSQHIRTVPGQGSSSHSGNYGGGDQYGRTYNDSEGNDNFLSRDPYKARGGGGGSGSGDGRRPPNRSGNNSRSTSEYNTAEEGTTSTSSEDSDDRPLGERPNALKAQKSLRMKIKDERRSRKETIKSVTRTVPELSLPRQEPTGLKISADELTNRLLRLRANDPPTLRSPTGQTAFPTLPVQSPSRATSPSDHLSTHTPPRSPIHGHFQPSNSSQYPSNFNNPTGSSGFYPSSFAFPSSPPSSAPTQPLRRHVTDVHSHHQPTIPRPPMPERSNTSFDAPRSVPMTPARVESRRPSLSIESSAQPKRSRADTLLSKLKSPSVGAPKLRARSTSLHSKASAPPLPPLPVPAMLTQSTPLLTDDPHAVMQMRIFISDLQRYIVAEIGSKTNAREVISIAEDRGDLTADEVKGGEWMLFEMANDFGMERPVREYEQIMDIYNSWNSETRVNYFMLKRTPLASVLAAHAIPKSSPTQGGYVEWEHKRGRWTKRWLELREHTLWLAKRKEAKDQTALCTLSNFDAYLVTRLHKSPKPFVFSIKSVQNMRMFENFSDYHHVFCCEAEEGLGWLRNVLLARSYVLHQERTILFRQLEATPSVTATTSSSSHSHPVASSSTGASRPSSSHRSESRRAPPPAPLLAFGQPSAKMLPPLPQPPHSTPAGVENFHPVPGSLLAKRL